MSNTSQTIITSALTAVGAIILSLTMGFGKQPAQNIYMQDGTNFEQMMTATESKITALGTRLEQVASLAEDVTIGGSRTVRKEINQRAKEICEEAMRKADEAKKTAQREAKAQREANRQDVFRMRAVQQTS